MHLPNTAILLACFLQKLAMAKSVILVALCALLPALVSATTVSSSYGGFIVHGRLYCDTCRAGFETNVTDYTSLKGSKVKLQCVNPTTLDVVYENFGVADDNGFYIIHVNYDHKEEICDVILMSSTNPNCEEPSSGRGRSRVIVTRENGIVTPERHVNNMGFLILNPYPGCPELIKSYFVE